MRGRMGDSLLSAALIAATGLTGCSSTSHPAERRAVPVTTEQAERGNQPSIVTGLGHVQGFYTADARAQASGQITRLFYQEGQAVRAGQPLAQIDQRPLQAALSADRALLQRDLAGLSGARDALARTAPLVAQGLASAQQVETLRVQVAQLAAAVAGDKAVVARDRLTLDYATIRAPISGVAGVRKVDPGNVVGPSDPSGIVTIVQIQPIALVFSVPQKDLPRIRAAMAKSVGEALSVVAVPQSGQGAGVLDTGKLTVVNNQISAATGTVELKAVFSNAAGKLWPGQLVAARLQVAVQPDTITVPSSAIQRNPRGTFIWLVANGHARLHAVKTGDAIGDRTVIASGLSGGETVVTDGQFALAPGAAVAVHPPAAAATAMRSDNPERLGIAP